MLCMKKKMLITKKYIYILICVMLCYVMYEKKNVDNKKKYIYILICVMLCYVMLCYVMLCYVMYEKKKC